MVRVPKARRAVGSLWNSALRPWLEFVLRYVVAIVIAVIVPLNLDGTTKVNARDVPKYSYGDQVTIGILIFIAGIILISTIDLKRLTLQRAETDGELDRVIARDDDLKRMADGLESLCRRDESRLLATLCEHETHKLSRTISISSDTLEYSLEPRFEHTRTMLACLGHDKCRFVHYLDNTDFLVHNTHSGQFWDELDDQVQHGALAGVERLFVVSNDPDTALVELTNEDSRRLIGFHEKNSAYHCKILRSQDYDAIQEQHFQSKTRLDCGIYGKKFLYMSEQTPGAEGGSAGAEVVGRLIADQEKVALFNLFFDDCLREGLEPDELQRKYKLEPWPKTSLQEFLRPDDHRADHLLPRRSTGQGAESEADANDSGSEEPSAELGGDSEPAVGASAEGTLGDFPEEVPTAPPVGPQVVKPAASDEPPAPTADGAQQSEELKP